MLRGIGRSEGAALTDAILVLNAGSSSIKFSLFAEAGIEPAVVASGQVESLDMRPHFIAKDSAGQTASEKRWAQGTELGHDGAAAHIVDWLKTTYGAQHRLVAVGHRVVHGGVDYRIRRCCWAATIGNEYSPRRAGSRNGTAWRPQSWSMICSADGGSSEHDESIFLGVEYIGLKFKF